MNGKTLKFAFAVLILISIGLTLKVFSLKRDIPQKSVSVPPTTVVSPSQSASEKIVDEFTHADYRIVNMFESEDYPYVIYIATEKSKVGCGNVEGSARCTNDTGCGSIYTSPTCFFFQEPRSVYGADGQSKYIGSIVKEGDLLFDTLNIKDNALYFKTVGGADGGAEHTNSSNWKLDLSTGIFSALKN